MTDRSRADRERKAPEGVLRRRGFMPALAQRACVLLLVVALALLSLPATSQAAILGDDYVGSTTVTDRGLNVTQAPAIDAVRGILVDSDGNILWSRSADERCAIASITKVMTAIVALENGTLTDTYTVSKHAASIGESTIGLAAGNQLTLEDLLNGMLVHSGNDAATAIAEGVAGSEDAFVDMMNEKVQQMGLSNTHFENPTGLPIDGYYSSASDVSVMLRYAMHYDTFREIVAKEEVTITFGGSKHTFKSSNALLTCWDSCIGGKTGTANASGQCLASVASQDGLELYAVILGCTDEVMRFTDSYKLLDWGFEHYKSYALASKDDVLVDVPLSGFLNRTVQAGVSEDVSAYVLDYDGDVSIDVKLVDLPDGVQEGEEVGTIIWRQGENVVASAPLVAKHSVGMPMPWTSVVTAAVRLIGVMTGDEAIAESKVYAQTLAIETSTDTAGQIMSAEVEDSIRSYLADY